METFIPNAPHGALIEDHGNICGNAGKCRVRCLPYFMLLGVTKSGTTDFFERIKIHPDVYHATNKELYYWTQLRFLINASIGDYADLFDKSVSKFLKRQELFMDDTNTMKYYPYILADFTSVTFTDDVWWRNNPENQDLKDPKVLKLHELHNVMPNTKLAVILRNPTYRLYSSYNMFRSRNKCGKSPQDFHTRVLMSIEWWNNCTSILPRRNCAYSSPPEMPPVVSVLTEETAGNNRWYGQLGVANYSGDIRRGMYSLFTRDWLSIFPRQQILFIKTEEYSKNTTAYFDDVVFPFLGMRTMPSQKSNKLKSKSKHAFQQMYRPMLPETKEILDNFYAPYNKELVEILNNKKWMWLE